MIYINWIATGNRIIGNGNECIAGIVVERVKMHKKSKYNILIYRTPTFYFIFLYFGQEAQ